VWPDISAGYFKSGLDNPATPKMAKDQKMARCASPRRVAGYFGQIFQIQPDISATPENG
jgi:hypothetical protein